MTDHNQAPARPSEGAVHELKTWPEYFNALLDGSKTFEVRKADRPFKVGDTLWLREFIPPGERPLDWGRYTGRETRRTVTYILAEPSPFAFPGFVVMGLGAADHGAAGGDGWVYTQDQMPEVGAEVECWVHLCDREIRCFMTRENFKPLISFRGTGVDGDLSLSASYVKAWRTPVPLPAPPKETT